MFKRSDRSAVFLAFVSVVCWSGAATAFKKALSYGSPWFVVFSASVISTVVFAVVLTVRKTRVEAADILSGLYLGFLNPFMYYMILLYAYNGLPAQIAMVVNYLWPVVLVLLSIPLLGQKLNKSGLLGIMLSFGGVAFLALSGGSKFTINAVPLGYALTSTVIWAMYWILNAKAGGKAASVLFTSFAFGSVYLFVYGFTTGQHYFLSQEILPWILYIGVFEMGLTYILWNTALRWASTTAAVSGMIFLTPFLALVFIQTVVGESIAPSTVGGLVLVAGGIMIEKHFRKGRNRVKPGP